ncbi:hypothetical protein B0T13DRAFT_126321 [Neurospora crassa]|nr:hypothetical protein B0T13DRAFT_126321 [Neurospora crassa]
MCAWCPFLPLRALSCGAWCGVGVAGPLPCCLYHDLRPAELQEPLFDTSTTSFSHQSATSCAWTSAVAIMAVVQKSLYEPRFCCDTLDKIQEPRKPDGDNRGGTGAIAFL